MCGRHAARSRHGSNENDAIESPQSNGMAKLSSYDKVICSSVCGCTEYESYSWINIKRLERMVCSEEGKVGWGKIGFTDPARTVLGPMARCCWVCPCLIRRLCFDRDLFVVSPLKCDCGGEFLLKHSFSFLCRHPRDSSVVPSPDGGETPPRRKLCKSLCFRTPPGPSDRGEWPVLNSVSGLFCQWRTNVSLVFSIRRMVLESSAAAPSNETRIAQAPVAERLVALPPARRWSCKCGSRYPP